MRCEGGSGRSGDNDAVRCSFRRVQVRQLLADAWSERANLAIAEALYVVLAERLDATPATTDVHPSNAPTLRVATHHP